MAVAPEAAPEVGITVAEAVGLPSLRQARVVAGAAGLDRVIRSVNMMEVPDIDRWLRAGELLVTTAYPIREDDAALAALIPRLHARGLAGLALKPGRYITAPPAPMLADADRLGFPLIELPPDASFNDILADVLGTILNRQALELERSHAIHARLTSVVLAGGGFPALVQAISGLTEMPAAILDTGGTVIAAAGEPPPGRAWRDSKAMRPVRAGRTTLGEVGVWSEAAPSRDVLVTLEHAATIAALEAVQSRALVTREQRFRSVLLNELVSGHPFDREEMVELATAFGWDLQVPRAAMVVEVARTRPLPIAGQPLEDQVATAARTVLGPTAIVWALRRSAAVLVEAGAGWPAGDVARALQRALQPLVPGATVSITIGRTYADLAEFHASFREAVQAMALGRDLRRGGFVLSHDELGVYRLLGALPDRVLDGYSTELLGPLIDYDRQHHSSLLDTLEVYLRRDRNMAATARELFVHYNTLRHRLERIEQVTGGIDRHPGGRLGLELALHARRILLSRR